MFNWLLRRRLSGETRRKLLIAAARSEEAIVDTHVANALELLEDLGDDVDLDRALELYLEMMGLVEPVSITVTNRVLARLESSGPRGVVVRGNRFENVFRDEKRPRPDRRRR